MPTPLYQIGGLGSGIKGSARQRQTAVQTVVPFMQAVLGGDFTKLSIFDSAVAAPPAVKVSRAHQMNEGGRIILEDFRQMNTNGTSAPSLMGFVNTWSSSLTVEQASVGENGHLVGAHQDTLLVGRVQWTSSTSSRSYQLRWANASVGLDFTGRAYLELRLDRDPADTSSPATDFGVRLLRVGGTSNTIAISSYTSLTGPPGIMTPDDNGNPYLSRPFAMGTVRIPMSAFTGAKNQVYGAELIINPNTSGQIYLANVRATNW